jgi:hypothetical protein
MNRREIEAMRERLAARTVSETEDPPILLGLVAFLFAFVFVVAMFV